MKISSFFYGLNPTVLSYLGCEVLMLNRSHAVTCTTSLESWKKLEHQPMIPNRKYLEGAMKSERITRSDFMATPSRQEQYTSKMWLLHRIFVTMAYIFALIIVITAVVRL